MIHGGVEQLRETRARGKHYFLLTDDEARHDVHDRCA
jgi:hypothetical protein